MSSDFFDNRERMNADKTLLTYELDELADFLLGNPSPTWDLAVYCSEEHIPKFLNAVLAGAKAESGCDILHEELVMTAIRGLICRYESTELPDSLGAAIVAAIRQLAARRPE